LHLFGQILQLAKLYKNIVGTDVSQQQLSYAEKRPNIRYVHTSGTPSLSDLHADVAPPDSVDLITVAQAFHWFDLPSFFEQVRSVLRKPDGVLAVWCYVEPVVDPDVDAVFWRLYNWSQPYWAPQRKIVDDRYRYSPNLFGSNYQCMQHFCFRFRMIELITT
jgi:cyclopropane fatty-acyl-phospholipid synthase-like methyltransferase